MSFAAATPRLGSQERARQAGPRALKAFTAAAPPCLAHLVLALHPTFRTMEDWVAEHAPLVRFADS